MMLQRRKEIDLLILIGNIRFVQAIRIIIKPPRALVAKGVGG